MYVLLYVCTVRKLQGFSVIQNLRETNTGGTRSSKTAVFAILGALNLIDLVDFYHSKCAKIHEDQNSEPLNVLK